MGSAGPPLKSPRLSALLLQLKEKLQYSTEPCLSAAQRCLEIKTPKPVHLQGSRRVAGLGQCGLHLHPVLWLACRFLFLKVMATLTELRSISAQHTQRLLRIQDIHPFATPLMCELFSTSDG